MIAEAAWQVFLKRSNYKVSNDLDAPLKCPASVEMNVPFSQSLLA
jgi:hypothetical protein